jgi:hypothetical protein
MKIKNLIKSLSEERWNIGFIINDLQSVMNGDAIKVNWIKHNYKDRWFADPFILDVTEDEIIVLVEEFYKPIGRGRISRLIIDKHSYELKKLDVVLQLDTHLSFPVIDRCADGIYIYPENGESRNLTLYKYDPISNKCDKVSAICDDAVEDAVCTDLFGKKLLFATNRINPNGNVLSIYSYDNKTDRYKLKEKEYFKENVARMAGKFFEYNGKIIRPTQECNVQYGHAVTLQEVSYTNCKWSFNEIRRIYSVNKKLPVGMHTFNMYKDVIVTDALGFDNMWIRRILKTIHLIH